MTSHQSMGNKGPVIKAQVHCNGKGPNPSITLLSTLLETYQLSCDGTVH
jgi:hypothetical protein